MSWLFPWGGASHADSAEQKLPRKEDADEDIAHAPVPDHPESAVSIEHRGKRDTAVEDEEPAPDLRDAAAPADAFGREIGRAESRELFNDGRGG